MDVLDIFSTRLTWASIKSKQVRRSFRAGIVVELFVIEEDRVCISAGREMADTLVRRQCDPPTHEQHLHVNGDLVHLRYMFLEHGHTAKTSTSSSICYLIKYEKNF